MKARYYRLLQLFPEGWREVAGSFTPKDLWIRQTETDAKTTIINTPDAGSQHIVDAAIIRLNKELANG